MNYRASEGGPPFRVGYHIHYPTINGGPPVASASGMSHGIGNIMLPGEWIGGFVQVDPRNNRTHLNEPYIITRINGKLFAGSVGKFVEAVGEAIAEQQAQERNRETGGVIAQQVNSGEAAFESRDVEKVLIHGWNMPSDGHLSPGHMSIEFKMMNGNTYYFSFYPAEGGKGTFKYDSYNDESKRWNERTEYDLTDYMSDPSDALSFALDSYSAPPDFCLLLGYCCTTYVAQVLNAGGYSGRIIPPEPLQLFNG